MAREVTTAPVQAAVTQVRGELAAAISGEVAWRTGCGLVEPRPDLAPDRAALTLTVNKLGLHRLEATRE